MVPFDMLGTWFNISVLCYSNFVLKMFFFSRYLALKMSNLDYWVRGYSTSLKVVNLIDYVWYCDLEIQVKGHSRSLNVAPFDRLDNGFLLVLYSNFVPKMHHF